ncbi:MAG: hypothetical protein HN742_12340 [Lentisphaerae bacterium]|jgi:hypothetical protein|nr:hypothetical protein [Lentisphaerota bacterium]MBT4821925.1 hypothetical protein [Lentisphaerota bacterium]MBT5607217.1 hypothetical protein [Lentisphaerota bacterium]MBT7054242.1 hypothetical protein [Lentisphaerota bacterium]MBT7842657.1 hypothetical protein [Lentisphaerota bacterium]
MDRLFFCVPLMALAASVSGEMLIKSDFSGPFVPLPTTKHEVTGGLPKGWSDDSAWAPMTIHYSQEEEQGLKYLRMEFTETDEGRAQLIFSPLPDAVNGPTRYRLHLTMRSPTGNRVEFGLRQRGKPYTFYWRTTTKLRASWDSFTHEFTTPKNDQPYGLWINLPELGTLEISSVELQRLSREERLAEIRAAHPDGGPRNLLRNTRFPMGLPNGWAIDRDASDGDEVQVGPATDAPGPSGAPALRLQTDSTVSLLAEPFALAYPLVPHAVVASMKGTGEWTFVVRQERRQIASHTVSLTDQWQRPSLTFKADLDAMFYQFTLSGSGTLLLDGVHIGPEEATTAYRTSHECEVAVAVAPSPLASSRILFEDMEPVVHWTATGLEAPALLQGKLTNAYGDEAKLPSSRLTPAAAGLTHEMRVDRFPERPLGAFRLELWVERVGQRISPTAELVFHRLRKPRYWGRDAPESPFGVHTNSTTRHILMAKAVGINWTRFHDAGLPYIGWWNLEPKPGEWQFFDEDIHRFRQHHVKIFAELGTAPPWASYYADTGLKSFGYFDKFFQPKDLKQYANYVRVVTKRYKGVIDAFDVWNEPWIHAWWGVAFDHEKGGRAGYITSKEPQKDFARLMQVARNTVRETLPDAIVAGINTTTGKGTGPTRFGGDEWTEGVVAAGGLAHCDTIAYHAYTGGSVGHPDDTIEKGLEVALGPIREKVGRVPKPVWMTEGSPLTHRMGNGLYKHTLPFPNHDPVLESSDRLARYLVSMRANGVSRIFLYSMHSHGTYRTEAKQWNALTTDDGALHPCGAAHSAAAWHLEDKRFVKRLDAAPGIHVYLFEGQGGGVAAISSSKPDAEFACPRGGGLRLEDLFGNVLPPGAPFTGTVVYASTTRDAAWLEAQFRGAGPR